jgi:7-carboxy-7-deazaguanine synthase
VADTTDSLMVNEIYRSVQGESTWAGLPCIFVRLTACNLRCSYCDTAYAFTEGRRWTFGDVLKRIAELADPKGSGLGPRVIAGGGSSERVRLPLIEFTGGEPLLQRGAVTLMRQLCDEGWTVLVETGGSLDISALDSRIHRIVDVKCPSSGESGRNRWANLSVLTWRDEVKFVMGTREDYEYAKGVLDQHDLAARCSVLFSWVTPLTGSQKHPALKPVPDGQTPVSRQALVEMVLADNLPVRFQLQMHKFIWTPEERGV